MPTDRVYHLLSDAGRLPDYFPPVTAVRATAGEAVVVTAGEGADSVAAEVDLDRDGPGTRIEWAVRGTPYTGIVIVQEGPSDIDSIVTVIVDDGDEHPMDHPVEHERSHDWARFGGPKGHDSLSVDALTRDRHDGDDTGVNVGAVLERALDHLRDYIETGRRQS